MNYDEGLAELEKITKDFSTGDLIDGSGTESDTRAKVVDRFLKAVLGWVEPQINREGNTEAGFFDYVLKCPHPTLVIEAKRIGTTFAFPFEKEHRAYSIQSLRSKKDDVTSAINQARAYADSLGVEYCCVTNGAQWLIFRAITRNEPWIKGICIVFRSLEDIQAHFTDFWNLLGQDSVRGNSLRAALAGAAKERAVFARALDGVLYADNALQRNKLSSQLQPLINGLFRDLTGPEQDSVLKRCYVTDRKVRGVWAEVQDLFNDTVPEFAKRVGFQDLVETPTRSGALDDDFRRAVSRGDFGSTILLLGGVGCGKTTFVHRFFRVTAKDFTDKHCAWFYVPFTEAPLESNTFGDFVRRTILSVLRDRYPTIDTASLPALEAIYKSQLDDLRGGIWSLLEQPERNRREVDFLERAVASPEHCDAVVQHLRRSGTAVTIILDNVDQREPTEQIRVFLLAHELCRAFDAIVVVTLREESFFRAEQAGAFNAYHNVRYHIASPDVRSLLQKRVDHAMDIAARGTDALRLTLRSGVEFNAKDIDRFMRVLHHSVLKENPAITQFIDAVSHGNMRSALDMFNQFMVSGSTNVEKMLKIAKTHGKYHVAEHEFVRAVMMGDFQFYKEQRSQVLNVFEVSSSALASNFTTLRMVIFLMNRAGRAHPDGTGFVSMDEALGAFADVFGDSDDAAFHLRRLIRRRLVEADNRQVSDLIGVKTVRLTSSGLYYWKRLIGTFQYLDLTSLDTPIWDGETVSNLRARAASTDLYERVERVEWLLKYLHSEEKRSLIGVSRPLVQNAFSDTIAAQLEKHFRSNLSRMAPKAHLAASRLEAIRKAIQGTVVAAIVDGAADSAAVG